MVEATAKPATEQPTSAWAPFAHAAFAVLWTATVISNVGTWMHDVASGWLMTSLSPSGGEQPAGPVLRGGGVAGAHRLHHAVGVERDHGAVTR
jgi:hypothetical protein